MFAPSDGLLRNVIMIDIASIYELVPTLLDHGK